MAADKVNWIEVELALKKMEIYEVAGNAINIGRYLPVPYGTYSITRTGKCLPTMYGTPYFIAKKFSINPFQETYLYSTRKSR